MKIKRLSGFVLLHTHTPSRHGFTSMEFENLQMCPPSWFVSVHLELFSCSLVVLIFVPFNIVISLNIVFDIQLLEYMIPPAPPAAPPSRVMVLVRVIALACAMMFCLQIDLEGADIINGLNVGWSSHQTEVKISDCSSWQESAPALKTQKYCVVC